MDIKRYVDLYDDIPTHGINAIAISVLQSAEMGLICLVEDILTSNCELDAVVAMEVDIGSKRKVADSIVGRRRLCLFECEVMVLTQVIFHPE